ncbi:MAG: hypothetical protein IJQ73_13020 [Kiritimatiellae bacterium]|nr:hypothetical protein [Kiritimatiellia bacterium]
MKTHAILLFSAALALCGCATDDARLRELDEALREAVRDAWAKAEAAAAQDEVAPPSGDEVPGGEAAATSGEAATSPQSETSGEAETSAAAPAADAVNFAALKWCWGAFDGSKAAEDAGARIGSLKVSASGLSYKWEKGGCERLGASSASDASCLACLFCFDGSAWRGGKFEWVSTSRTTRDMKNVESGYEGWDAAAFRSAKAYAFVIVSKDGRKRTNVAVQN